MGRASLGRESRIEALVFRKQERSFAVGLMDWTELQAHLIHLTCVAQKSETIRQNERGNVTPETSIDSTIQSAPKFVQKDYNGWKMIWWFEYWKFSSISSPHCSSKSRPSPHFKNRTTPWDRRDRLISLWCVSLQKDISILWPKI